MKCLFTPLICLFIAVSAFSQVNYQSLSFSDALKKARDEGKLIFVQFESKDCNQCNEVADKGLSDKDLAEKVQETFIPLKISVDHPDRKEISSKYNMLGFGTLFIDANGTLIHSFLRTSTRATEYQDQISIAMEKAGESMKIGQLEQEYKNGNRGFGVLELLLEKRKLLNLPLDSLLDEYVTVLPKDSLTAAHTIQFISRMAPLVGSIAEKSERTDLDAFNTAWYQMPLQERVTINNMIMYKSMKKAVAEKNVAYAYKIAGFAYAVNSPNTVAGARAAAYQMLNFYKGIDDTLKYLMAATRFYDDYLMTVKVDSIKGIDSAEVKRLFVNAPAIDTVKDGKRVMRKMVSYVPRSQYYASQLNDAAYTFYTKTSNPEFLFTATRWAKRALEFFQTPQALDTYSRLLYKTQHTQEAIEFQEKSIALRKKQGFPTTEYDAILEKMKSGASID